MKKKTTKKYKTILLDEATYLIASGLPYKTKKLGDQQQNT